MAWVVAVWMILGGQEPSVMIFGVSTACTVRLAALMVLELLRSRSPWIIAVLATFCAA